MLMLPIVINNYDLIAVRMCRPYCALLIYSVVTIRKKTRVKDKKNIRQ